MHDVPPEPAPGSVPHHWGNALARRWAPEMPRPLTGGFLTTLYALRTLASKDGYLRYDRDGRPIPLAQIAKAVRCDVRDLRLYLSAAIAAGVLTVDGPRRRGVPVLYVLLPSPRPSWAAAVAVVDAGRRRKRTPDPAPWEDETPATRGHRAPTPEEGTRGHRAPTSADTGWGHRAPTDIGAPRPQGVGAPRPHHPGSTHDLPHEMVSVEPQLQGARGHDAHDETDGPSPSAAAPSLQAVPGSAATGRDRAPRPAPGQPPLLLPVQGPARPAERPAYAPEGERSIGAPPGGWRAAVARERPDAAAAAYRDRWTGPHAHLLDDPTGT